jgi:cyclic beta-1,2-glucan synthetase
MDRALPNRRRHESPVVETAIGALFVVMGVMVSLVAQQALPAGLFGMVGFAIWRRAARLPVVTPIAILDFLAFAIFAFQRNDNLAFWQLVGPWADVWRWNVAGAAISYSLYVVGKLFALTAAHRTLRVVEALGLILIPFMFNMVVTLGADWHMAEIAKLVPIFDPLDFRFQVFVGRAVTLFGVAEIALALLSFIELNRWQKDWRLHALLAASAALGAATPLIANAPQAVTAPVLLIAAGVIAGSIAQASLWSLVYVATGLPLDALVGRPASFAAVRGHWRDGFVKGAIYGGVFMAIILIASSALAIPGLAAALRRLIWITGPIGGALAFPFAQTLIGSADGTPPFFGRLEAAYRNRTTYARGLVIGVGLAFAFQVDLPAAGGWTRFVTAFLFGALAYAGVDAVFDYQRIANRERTRMETWRKYALGAGLGGIVAGAIGWYFDAAQVDVVTSKFWAYADVDYRASGRHIGDFVTYPIFNKYGAINLGQVAGGVRLFWAESVSGVINWSLAAPLFSINFVLLSALIDRSLKPFRGLISARGAEGLIEQAVRVMRWGLWMAPIINTFLRQSPDPSWYNQDGAVRTLVATGAEIVMPYGDYRNFSLTVFLGLLAYDWLRVVIWFDHMGLRVATLVNLSFIGGDRADEAAGRFLGAGARTRAIPDGIRRFGTWAPLLIPFYIPRGAEWDKAWTGAEQLSHGGPMPTPVSLMGFVYSLAAAGIGVAALLISERLRPPHAGVALPAPDAPPTLADLPETFSFTNGEVSMEVWRDGRGAASVTADARGGFAIDLFRRPLDPLQPRGQFFYLGEGEGEPWSVGFQPTRRAGEYSIRQSAFNEVEIVSVFNDVRATLRAGPDAEGAVLSYHLRLADLAGRPRRLRLTSFAEIAGHETGHYARDLDFAGMHVETIFVRRLNAILARNRLLRSPRAGRGETSFFAVKPGAQMELVGYEDSRTRFLGEGSMRAPTGCEAGRWRSLDDEGKLWTFDPAASFTLSAEIPARGEVEAEFVIGRADNAVWASELISRRLNLPPLPELQLQTWLYETRSVEPAPGLHSRWPFAFANDGKTLHLSHRTPRPWAHVMANELGASAMVSNDGDIYSAFGNSRHNALTAFRFDSATTPLPGQIVYLRNLETRETDSTGFAPFQRADATMEIAYEPGVAAFVKRRGALASTYEIFVPPDFPGDMRLLTLTNGGAAAIKLRIAPFFDMALDEGPNESAGHLEAKESDGVLLFENRRNDFVRGVAFVATTLTNAMTETVRSRFFGPAGRDITCPAMVEAGEADLCRGDDGRRVAAFAADIELKAGQTLRFAFAIGMGRDAEAALGAAKTLTVEEAEKQLAATRARWAKRLSVIAVETNRPDFDRLVNTWLPYQLYASRLFGRVGPNQRGGAYGYRDQLQDVLPLTHLEPRLTRAQIVLHAGQQFLEGDVLKWWHVAPGGGTGIGQRTKASDPHLWLPYVLARYVRETGDATVLDEVQPFLEGPAVPERDDTLLVAPRPSLETATVYEHARLAILYTWKHIGENGLPLLRAGDWNDGIDALGRAEKGTGVWMGFFLYNVIDGFLPLARLKNDDAFVARCETEIAKLKQALEVGWFGDHYGLDFADDGRALSMPNAMTTGWAAHSGATPFERAVAALEGGLKGIEKANRILLLEHPFFEHSDPYPGRIADYPPGVRENGGQYSHGASWIIDGFARVAREAGARGDGEAAQRLYGRAFEMFEKISPLRKTEPDTLPQYGLAPIQQPADIYDGFGHGGRGGWSWYTGSAARMLSAAYAIVGIEMTNGELALSEDAFAPKGALQVKSVRIGEQEWRGR